MEVVEAIVWPFLFAAFFVLYIALRKNERSHFSQEPPPGPTPLPLLGNLLQLGSNPHRSLAKLARKHGPVMALKLGTVYTIIVSSPSSAKQVLQTRDHYLSARQVPDVVQRQGYHVHSVAWMPTNNSWKYQRALMKTHMFNLRALDASQALRQRKIHELVAFIKGQTGRPIYIGRVAFCTMLNLISNSFFSMDIVDINSDAAQEFKDLIGGLSEVTGSPNISDFFPFLAPLDLQGRSHRFGRHFIKLMAIFERIIKNRLGGERSTISYDILDLLLKHEEDDGQKLNMQTIKALLFDIFVAGTDTSSTTVEWAMAELLHNPELMEKAQSEIGAVVGFQRAVEESDLPRLTFIHALLKETLRLHPPAPFLLPHKAVEDTEIEGYKVPKGSQVLVNIWAIGRDERVWENPDNFMPERFMGKESEFDFHGQNFEFLPFGSGRRICPGLHLGVRMVELMLASFIQSFSWKLPEGKVPADLDLQEKFGVTLVLASPLKASAAPTNQPLITGSNHQ